MRKYKVNVNGTDYEIKLEVLEDDGKAAPAPAAPKAAAPKAAAAPAGGETVNSPMPGTILSVNVQVGATVSEGDVLMILEAMKMENEIMAPVSGKVTSVAVSKGATVESGTVLCTIA